MYTSGRKLFKYEFLFVAYNVARVLGRNVKGDYVQLSELAVII